MKKKAILLLCMILCIATLFILGCVSEKGGGPPPDNPNKALMRDSKASSEELFQGELIVSKNAFDGKMTTRWGSKFANNEWIYVDLGEKIPVKEVVLKWEAAFGTEYLIEISDDGENWTEVYHETAGDGGTDIIILEDGIVTQFVRMFGLGRGTPYGFSLWEFEVYSEIIVAPKE